MKNLLSNISFYAVLIAFVGLVISFILSSQTLGLCSGLVVLLGITLNLVVNSLKIS